MTLIRRTPHCRDQLPTKQDLSPARRKLLEKLQQVNFGQIRHLQVNAGEPVFARKTAVIRHVKLGADNGPHPKLAMDQFVLHPKVVELLAELDRLQNGWIDRIEVCHGIPLDLFVREAAA